MPTKHRRAGILLFLLFAVSVPSICKDRGGPVEYIGGTIEKLEPGEDGSIYTTNAFSLLITTKKTSIGIPPRGYQ